MAGRIMRASRRGYFQQSGIACGMAITRGFSTSTPSYKTTCSNFLKVSERQESYFLIRKMYAKSWLIL